MNIIITGCGKIGSALAEELNNEGHNITIIDTNARVLRELAENLDIIGVNGNGALLDVQKEADVSNADLFIAATGSDEVNMLCCLIAKKEGHCETIARIRSTEYDNERDYLKKALGISAFINPEKMCAHEIARLLRFPAALEIETFSSGRVDMIKMKLSEKSTLCDTALKDLTRKVSEDALICIIERNGEAIIPSGDTILRANDRISFIAMPSEAAAFCKRLKPDLRPTNSAIIVGGGKIASYTARYMKTRKTRCSMKFIEIKEDVCQEFSSEFPEYTFIHADGTNKNTLIEEGIHNTDAIVTVTGIDEQNVLLSLLMNDICDNRLRVITKVNRFEPEDIPESLRVGSIVCPKSITADSVVRFVRALESSANYSIESLYKVAGGRVEAQEYEIYNESAVTNVALKDLNLKKQILIAAIIRDNKLLRPGGSDMLKVEDHVVIITLASQHIRELTDILA